jgi:hypothetical protein
VLGQFSFHYLVHHVLQKYLYAFVSEQNFAKGLLVERRVFSSKETSIWVIVVCVVDSTLVGQTNLTGGGGPFPFGLDSGQATVGFTQDN